MTVVLAFMTTTHKCKEHFDTGASRSFMNRFIVGRLGLRARRLLKASRLFVATVELLYINSMGIGKERNCFPWGLLVGVVPYDLVLGLYCPTNYNVACMLIIHKPK